MLGVGIWVERFRCAAFYFEMAMWKLCASKTFEFSLFQPVQCAGKNPISLKVFNRFSRNFASARRCWGCAFGWKVSAAEVFYFCNGKVKTFRMDNIWNFPLSTCTLCQLKSYSYEGIQPIFGNIASARRCWGWAFGWKVSGCGGILLLQWQGESFASSSTFEFSHFQPVQYAGKNPISPKVFNGFSKTLLQLDDVEGAHLDGKFQLREVFYFHAMARWKLCASSTFVIFPLSICTMCREKSHISKGIQPIFENIASGWRCWGWAFGRNVSDAEVFYFFNGKVKALRIVNVWIFPLSTCTMCRQKSHISKGIQPIFENFASARRCWGCAFGWKVSAAEVFYFCNGKVKTFRMDNIWNFPLSTCTLCQLKSYSYEGIQPIFENIASARRGWGWAFGWKILRCGGILLLQGNVKTLSIQTIWNFPFLSFTMCRQESNIAKDIQPMFEKFASSRRCWVWAFG